MHYTSGLTKNQERRNPVTLGSLQDVKAWIHTEHYCRVAKVPCRAMSLGAVRQHTPTPLRRKENRIINIKPGNISNIN